MTNTKFGRYLVVWWSFGGGAAAPNFFFGRAVHFDYRAPLLALRANSGAQKTARYRAAAGTMPQTRATA
jgi:hypothetical protein